MSMTDKLIIRVSPYISTAVPARACSPAAIWSGERSFSCLLTIWAATTLSANIGRGPVTLSASRLQAVGSCWPPATTRTSQSPAAMPSVARASGGSQSTMLQGAQLLWTRVPTARVVNSVGAAASSPLSPSALVLMSSRSCLDDAPSTCRIWLIARRHESARTCVSSVGTSEVQTEPLGVSRAKATSRSGAELGRPTPLVVELARVEAALTCDPGSVPPPMQSAQHPSAHELPQVHPEINNGGEPLGLAVPISSFGESKAMLK